MVEREKIVAIDEMTTVEELVAVMECQEVAMQDEEKDDGTTKEKEVKLNFLEFSEDEAELKFHIVKVNKEVVQVNSEIDYEVTDWCMDKYFHVEIVEDNA